MILLRDQWKTWQKTTIYNCTPLTNKNRQLVKALILVTWPSFYQHKSTLPCTKLKHFHFRTCINNWLQYASNIVMLYSLICITYLTPLFIACNLINSINTPGTRETLKNHQRNVLSSCSHWYWSKTTLHLMESIFYKSTEPLWEQIWHLHTPTSSWGNLKN
jgi:hypothetical protein